MASISKRINKKGQTTYLIRVFLNRRDGKANYSSVTYKPETNMKLGDIKRELNRIVVELESKAQYLLTGHDSNVTFRKYSEAWLDYAQIAYATKSRYSVLLRRINEHIGNIRLKDLRAAHLEDFYKVLACDGESNRHRYFVSTTLSGKINITELAEKSRVSRLSIRNAIKSRPVSKANAMKIADALNVPFSELFSVCETPGLSPKTIRHHHTLIANILNKAKKERIIDCNVASEQTNPPKVRRKEANYLNVQEARNFIDALSKEDDSRVKTSLTLLIYSGVRRGELCGLRWEDIEPENLRIRIRRAVQFRKGKGVVESDVKTDSSIRNIYLPEKVFNLLRSYRDEREVKSDWVFAQSNGRPISPNTINLWLNKLVKKNNLPRFSPHCLRHTFSTLQLAANTDIKTLQIITGHSQTSTLLNIYAHVIAEKQISASGSIDRILFDSVEQKVEQI